MSRTVLKTTLLTGMLFAASTFSAQASESIEAWTAKAQQEIAIKKHYPREAIQKGVEGKVRLRLAVAETGLVKGVEIVETSGSKLLDKEAMRLAMRIDNLPSLPSGLKEHSFIVPIRFRLDEKAITENMNLSVRLG